MTLSVSAETRRWLGLAILCSAFFMVILDVAIVNVALPSIAADLRFSPHGLQWVVSAYVPSGRSFVLTFSVAVCDVGQAFHESYAHVPACCSASGFVQSRS